MKNDKRIALKDAIEIAKARRLKDVRLVDLENVLGGKLPDDVIASW
jgi:hypothetical protein